MLEKTIAIKDANKNFAASDPIFELRIFYNQTSIPNALLLSSLTPQIILKNRRDFLADFCLTNRLFLKGQVSLKHSERIFS